MNWYTARILLWAKRTTFAYLKVAAGIVIGLLLERARVARLRRGWKS